MNVLRINLKIKSALSIFGLVISLLSTSAFAAMHENEELAEFNAALLFLRYHCSVPLTDEQTKKITFSYIYDRRIATDKIDLIAQQELNIDRYRDLTTMDIALETKCAGLKKTFSSVLNIS
ncbi:hypothetical protein [Thorsellia anophelis]|uniref:Type II secretion system pilotin lipoprotein (PulS_OutS) n=1 Tax=Thorsellia anophelis DSM 18579 TaxID=1123402 RepID=A0A1I0A0F4_9GAMM|nr:hypothetical protein [Thorsellia anophelis]SES87146.1 hypothetical protein SAMN02583745_00776 [Thorsellia anophelis DSM 18579]